MKGTRKLSTAVLSLDLIAIQKEAGQKIVIILDECDVLSASRVTLQILRNVFMNLDGFMLVIAGTPRLFPVFDEVFSPINRQFYKIPISPFEDENETKACVAQPLGRVELDPNTAFSQWPHVVEEIHRVTGGRPYEIQLLCHTMFRRVQEGHDVGMAVSLDVLDTVRKDLENRQGHDAARLSNAFAELSDQQLVALGALRRIRGGSVADAEILMHIDPVNKTFPVTREEFREYVRQLSDLKIVTCSEGRCQLEGDQFDEVYLRYLAASRGIWIPAWSSTVEAFLRMELADSIGDLITGSNTFPWAGYSMDAFARRLEAILGLSSPEATASVGSAFEWRGLYWPLKDSQAANARVLPIITIRGKIGAITFVEGYVLNSNVSVETLETHPTYVAFRNRVEELDGTLTVAQKDLSIADVPPADELVLAVPNFSTVIAEQHDSRGVALFKQEKYDEALIMFEKSFEWNPSIYSATAAAFQALNLGDWRVAIEWCDKGDSVNTDNEDNRHACLTAYDRGVAYLMLEDEEACRRELVKVRELWHGWMAELTDYLLEPVKGGPSWTLVPRRGSLLDLVDNLERALSVAQQAGS